MSRPCLNLNILQNKKLCIEVRDCLLKWKRRRVVDALKILKSSIIPGAFYELVGDSWMETTIGSRSRWKLFEFSTSYFSALRFLVRNRQSSLLWRIDNALPLRVKFAHSGHRCFEVLVAGLHVSAVGALLSFAGGHTGVGSSFLAQSNGRVTQENYVWETFACYLWK